MRWENVFQVEIDHYCQKVLQKNFPNVKRYGDIREFNGTEYRGHVDIISGGFPCQPFSVAGKRKGTEDERALWPQMLRAIREVQPRYVVAENVSGLLTISGGLVFEQVCLDLEGEGYEVQPVIIPASGKNAPHQRERVWIVAYSESNGALRESGKLCKKNGRQDRGLFREPVSPNRVWSEYAADPARIHAQGCNDGQGEGQFRGSDKRADSNPYNSEAARQQRNGGEVLRESESGGFNDSGWQRNWYEVATRFCRVDDGIPNRVDRLKGLGNAIVPQVAYEIFKAIEAAEYHLTINPTTTPAANPPQPA